MAKSPTSQSATTNNVAKDDVLGHDGDFTFTVKDLLANDPGGANKNGNFFFGNTADQYKQAAYLEAHGITDNHDGTYTLTSAATDFDYFVQMGNNGTWSQAHVDVTAPVPHDGDVLFSEDFEGYAKLDTDAFPPNFAWAPVDLSTNGWTTNAGHNTELVQDGYANAVHSTSGDYWLDTQATTGGINISHAVIDTTGGQAHVSFDLGLEDLRSSGNGTTAPDAAFDFKFDGKVIAHITAQEMLEEFGYNQMHTFDYVVDTGAAGSSHTLELVDVTPVEHASNFGFSLDTIVVHDWVV